MTLLELLTVICIIVILLMMIFPAISGIRARMEKVHCMQNLRTLYFGTNSYVQQNGSWPQIDAKLLATQKTEYAKRWISALQPFGLDQRAWICPTTQKLLGSPDLTKPENTRLDYIPMPFDTKAMSPYLWPKQPWFIERSTVHGNGNLIMFTNGSVQETNDVISGLYH